MQRNAEVATRQPAGFDQRLEVAGDQAVGVGPVQRLDAVGLQPGHEPLAGAKVVIAAHLGRPKGEPDPKYSLAPVAERLGEELGRNVQLAADVVGSDALARAEGLTDGDVLLLENVRFDARETSKVDAERESMAKQLAELVGDDGAFVSDGFGVVHRKQASVYDVAKLLPHFAGQLVEREVDVLTKLTTDPARPYAVVLGGSKVSDKLGVIESLAPKVDTLVIGGGCIAVVAYRLMLRAGRLPEPRRWFG